MTREDAHKLMTAGYAKKNAGQAGGDEEIERGRRALKELERRGLL
jgi:hypothetical protein